MTQGQGKYLLIRSGRFYFRRRIAGLSTYFKPLTLSLGTTDRESAILWSGRVVVEFDRMLNSFVSMTPELPEELVAQCIQVCLSQTLSQVTRQ
ncbi:MAG: hypothetical protein ACQEVT_11025, partial [Pseudomonadota bacterium]